MTHAGLNSLIARVKAETATHEHPIGHDEKPGTKKNDLQLATIDALVSASDLLAAAGIGQLLLGGNDEFVDTAYRLLLGREADTAGKVNYVEQLSRGASRLGVAARIRLSGEGCRLGVSVRGLGLPMALTAAHSFLRRVGLGALSATALARLDARATRRAAPFAQQRAVERMLAAWRRPLERIAGVVPHHDRQLAELSKRIDDLQQAVASAPTVPPKVAEAYCLPFEDANRGSQENVLAKLAIYEDWLASLMKAPAGLSHSTVAPVPTVPPGVIDAYYLAFEDANRGSRESVLAKLAIYEDWLASLMSAPAGLSHSIVDIGCGRGEWLSYVTEKGVDAVGIDMNSVMVDVCLQRGLDARCTDALLFLRSLPTGSVAAVTGFHVIEHVTFDYLFALVAESYRVLAEGGAVLFETPNPENVLVGSHTFYHDFTHRNPITPTAISFLLKHQGFDDIDIIRSSPYPDEAKVPGNDPLTERVNGHLCGPQDFAVTGRKNHAAGGGA